MIKLVTEILFKVKRKRSLVSFSLWHGFKKNQIVIVIKNGKIVWKHGSHCLYFCLNLKYLGWMYKAYIKIAKNCDFWVELLSENDFEAVLATFCCYDQCFWGSWEDRYKSKRVLQMLFVCYNLMNSENILFNQ